MNTLEQELITALLKYQTIMQEDIYIYPINNEIIDFLLEEMIRCEYITPDFDEEGNLVFQRKIRDSIPNKPDEKSNVIFLKSTNKEMQEEYIFYDGKLEFRNHQLYFYGRFEELIFRTSVLTSYEIEDSVITFKTMNSIYTFKVLKELDIDESILLSPKKIKELRETRDALIVSGAFFV